MAFYSAIVCLLCIWNDVYEERKQLEEWRERNDEREESQWKWNDSILMIMWEAIPVNDCVYYSIRYNIVLSIIVILFNTMTNTMTNVCGQWPIFIIYYYILVLTIIDVIDNLLFNKYSMCLLLLKTSIINEILC